MKDSWIGMRKDIFIRDLFRDFFNARFYFDSILSTYHTATAVPFTMMDTWVGTETKKGPLWSLKDQSHKLFRNKRYKPSLYEHLFDWTLGSIFHESMKLKEDAYQIESYKPLLELKITGMDNKPELSKIISEYFSLIDKANKDLKQVLRRIDELFSKAVFHMRGMFATNRNNTLLLRYLLDNKTSVEIVFGKNSFDRILLQVFPEGIHKAYLTAAEQCNKNGWYHEAKNYLTQAVQIDKKNKKLRQLLQETEVKISKENNEELQQ